MLHDDNAVILDILLHSRRAVEALEGTEFELFRQDWKVQSIVLHQLLLVGEGVKRLSPEFRERHNVVPWRRIAGMRDILIHCYDAVDLPTVWQIVKRDLPPFIRQIEGLAPQE